MSSFEEQPRLPLSAHDLASGAMASVAAPLTFKAPRLLGVVEAIFNIQSFHQFPRKWTVEGAIDAGEARLALVLLLRRPVGTYDPTYISYMCDNAATKAAAQGRVHVLIQIDQWFPQVVFTNAARVAAMGGHSRVLRWLFDRGDLVCWSDDVLSAATARGHLSCLRYLCGWFDICPHVELLQVAVKARQVVIAQWLWLSLNDTTDIEALGEVVSSAPRELAEWMVSHAMSDIPISIDSAAARGDLRFIQWASTTRLCTASVQAMDNAAAGGHLDVLTWLHENRHEGCTTAAIDLASKGGHYGVVVWLVLHRREGASTHAVLSAVCSGDLHLLKVLLNHRAPVPACAFDYACGHGQRGIATFLLARGLARPTHRAMDWAATNGHLGVVQWLNDSRVEGCTHKAMDGAAANGHLRVLKWLHANRTEGCSTAAMDEAARHVKFETLDWLREFRDEGCTKLAMIYAGRSGSIMMARWLYTRGYTSGVTDAMDAALGRGHFHLVCWLFQMCRATCTEVGVEDAAAGNWLQCLEFLRVRQLVPPGSNGFIRAAACKHLYTAGWFRRNSAAQVDIEEATEHYDRNGWSDAIVSAAIGTI